MTKILLVEDDKGLREIYSVRLLAEGYTLISSGDGEEALAAAIGEKPDLIISDVMMPKISGFEMLDLLRSNENTKNIPVIMLTALSSEQQRERGTRLGADRYLVKSQVGIEDIVRTVHEVLGDSDQNKNIEQLQDSLALGSPQSAAQVVNNQSTDNAADQASQDSQPDSDEIDAYTQELNSPAQPSAEPINGNPSIVGTNFGTAANSPTQTPNKSDTATTTSTDSGNMPASTATQPINEHTNDAEQAAMAMQNMLNQATPSMNQSAFNPPAATEPSRVAGVTAPELPDRPMNIPAKMDQQPSMATAQPHTNMAQSVNNFPGRQTTSGTPTPSLNTAPQQPAVASQSAPQQPVVTPQQFSQTATGPFTQRPAIQTQQQTIAQSPFRPAQPSTPQPLQRPIEQAHQFAVPPAEPPAMPKPIQQASPAPITGNPMFDHSGAQSVNGSDDEPVTQPQSSTGQLSGRGGERIIAPPVDGSSQGPRINIDELLASASANESNSMFPTTGQ